MLLNVLSVFLGSMDPKDAINRYFYLRTMKHEFLNRNDESQVAEIVDGIPEYLLKLVEAYDAMAGVDLARRAIQSKTLIRKNEVFHVLAYFVRKIDTMYTNPDLTTAKHEIYENLPEMFDNGDDLLLFIQQYNKWGSHFREYYLLNLQIKNFDDFPL